MNEIPETGDLYANTDDIYLRVDGKYYHRKIGFGWKLVTPESVANIAKWSPLHEKQREAYFPAMIEQGLIS